MAIVAQRQIFSWSEACLEFARGSIGRVLGAEFAAADAFPTRVRLPDEPLMQALETKRAKGRDKYPVRPMWNSLIAGVVFGHDSIASLRRELLRNAQLRQMCGFIAGLGTAAAPSAWNYTRFLKNLMAHQNHETRLCRLT